MTPYRKNPEHLPRLGETVRAYRNLNAARTGTGQWTLQTRRNGKWKVGAHADAVDLSSVVARQPTAAGIASIRRTTRNVVAWFVGTLGATDDGVTVHGDTERIRFNPFHDDGFHIDGVRWDGASQAYLDTDGTAHAAR